jgi:rod shape-determining protein MreC
VFAVFIIAIVFALLNCWGGSGFKSLVYNKSFGLQAFLWQQGSVLNFNNQNQNNLSQKLIADNQKLLSDLADLDSLKKENETLRQALNIGLNSNYELIMTQVTAKNNISIKGVSFGDSLLINKGSNDGVKKGFPVVLSNKILLGKIVDVYPSFSRVALISSKDSIIDVQLQNIQDFALAKGLGNQKITLDMFPRDKDLQSGTLVLTSALGGAYPSGMVIGTIGNVNIVSSEVFKKAEIIPAYNIGILDKVFVIKNVIVTNGQ